MKKIIFLLVSLVSIVGIRAESVLVDGLLYDILSDDDLTVQVVGNKLAPDALVDVVIPGTVSIGGKEYTVRRIKYAAFMRCNAIKSVTIPSSVQAIETRAFQDCTGLRRVTISDADSLVLYDASFDGCYNIFTVKSSGNVRTNYGADISGGHFVFGSAGESVPQLVIAGDIPKFFFDGVVPFRNVIIEDNVSDLRGVTCLFPEHLYTLSKTPPTLGGLEDPNDPSNYGLKHTFVHVPTDSYAAYFQAPLWSSFHHINNDAVETRELSFSSQNKQLKVGEAFTLSVSKDGTLPVYVFTEFSTYNQRCVAIDVKYNGDWELTGVRPGEITIVAACGELEDTCHITVVESTPIVTLNKSDVRMRTNRTTTVTYTVENVMNHEIEFSIDKPEVALARMVDDKIEVLSVAPGVATLTVKTKEGDCVPGICKFTIYDPDVNGDTTVDVSDVNTVINMMLGKEETTPAADMTGSGTVDVSDVNAVINVMLGKE